MPCGFDLKAGVRFTEHLHAFGVLLKRAAILPAFGVKSVVSVIPGYSHFLHLLLPLLLDELYACSAVRWNWGEILPPSALTVMQ